MEGRKRDIHFEATCYQHPAISILKPCFSTYRKRSKVEIGDELSLCFGYPLRSMCTWDLSRATPLALNLAITTMFAMGGI